MTRRKVHFPSKMPSHAHSLTGDTHDHAHPHGHTHSYLHEFCQRTSLHGWNLCFRPGQSPGHSVFWLMVILSSVCSLGYMMFVNIQEFSSATVSFNLESRTVPLDEVFLPSMVVCNMNLLRRSFLLSILKDPSMNNVTEKELRWFMISQFIRGSNDEDRLSAENSTLAERLYATDAYRRLSQEYVDNIDVTKNLSDAHIIKWHGQLENVLESRSSPEQLEQVKRDVVLEIAAQFRDDELVSWIKFPGYGLSITPGFITDINEACTWMTPFVKEPEDVDDYRTMVPSAKNGVNNGLELLLDAEVYDYSYSYSGKEGFVVSVLHQLDQPIMRHSGMEVATGYSVQLAVSPKLLGTTQAAKRRFTPTQRQCYFEDEIKLKHFPHSQGYRYEMSNCLFESTVQRIERDCGCMPYFFAGIVLGYDACTGKQKKCMSDLTDNIGGERTIMDDGVQKECLAACIDQTNSVRISQAGYPTNQAFPGSADFCRIFKKLAKSCNGDRRLSLNLAYPQLCPTVGEIGSIDGTTCSMLYKVNVNDIGYNFTEDTLERLKTEVTNYARLNMAKVVLFIKDPYVEKYLTEEKITETSFVGTVGGLMGLFMGFSFLSVVEVAYFIFLRLLHENKEKKIVTPILVAETWKK